MAEIYYRIIVLCTVLWMVIFAAYTAVLIATRRDRNDLFIIISFFVGVALIVFVLMGGK